MTAEEIKENTNMTDVLSRYGIEVNRGLCKCPFHDDKHPSMKVYKDGVRCFTCSQSWDVFGFIMQMDNCDFKTAYLSLGGTYKHESKRARLIARSRREEAKAIRQQHKMVRKELYHAFNLSLSICELADQVYPPMSDEWCEIKNAEPVIKWMYEEIFINQGNEVSDLDAYRECKRLNERFIP